MDLRLRPIALPVLAIAAVFARAVLAEPPTGELKYTVNHPVVGCLDLARNTVSRDGNRIIVESTGRLEVRLGDVVVIRQAFERRETYEAGRLVEYKSRTVERKGNEDEVEHEVSTRWEDGQLIVRTNNGEEYVAPPDVYTTNPLFVEATTATHLIGSTTGNLHIVGIMGGQSERIELENGPVTARHFSVSGPTLEAEWWYDEDDILVRLLVNDGGIPFELLLTERESCPE